MARLIDREIRRRLADAILFGELQGGGTATVGCDDDGIVITCQRRQRSAQPRAATVE